jgi:hypothetical protein
MKRIKRFEEHRKKKKKKRNGGDGSVEFAFRLGQEYLRDWQTDAYRSQSGKREAEV